MKLHTMCRTDFPLHASVFPMAVALQVCATSVTAEREIVHTRGEGESTHDEIQRPPPTLSDSGHDFNR